MARLSEDQLQVLDTGLHSSGHTSYLVVYHTANNFALRFSLDELPQREVRYKFLIPIVCRSVSPRLQAEAAARVKAE